MRSRMDTCSEDSHPGLRARQAVFRVTSLEAGSGEKRELGMDMFHAADNENVFDLLGRCDLKGLKILLETSKVDLNRRNSAGKTCLEFACDLKLPLDFFREMLQAGADPNNGVPNLLHRSCFDNNLELLHLLLQEPTVDVNCPFPNSSETILTRLCWASCTDSEKLLLLSCLEILLKRPEIRLNKPDENGNTAIMYALENDFEDRVKLFVEQKVHTLDLNRMLLLAGRPVLDEIKDKFSDMTFKLPPPLGENIESTDPQIKFFAALQTKNIAVFEELASQVDVNYFYEEPYYTTCLELACQMSNAEKFVKCLLENGVDPVHCRRAHKVPLLHYAVSACNPATLELLIPLVDPWENDDAQHTVIQVVANRRVRGRKDDWRLVECTRRLLGRLDGDERIKIINNMDVWGDTALHDAARLNNEKLVVLFLHYGASLTIKNREHDIPLSFISEDILRTFLDENVSSKGTNTMVDEYRLMFDYSFLTRGFEGDYEMKPLELMARPELRKLLTHPVLHSFLLLKWQHLRCVYLIDILLYLLFVISMSVYILMVTSDRHALYNKGKFDNSSENSSLDTETEINDGFECLTNSNTKMHTYFLFRCIFGFTLYGLIMREIVQFFIHRTGYLFNWRNYFNIFVILTSMPLLINPCLDASLELHLFTISLMLAWTELILVTGSLPVFSVQLMMLRTVAFTFLHFMLWYSLILIPFGFCFFILFGRSVDDFSNLGHSMFSTVSMFTGEIQSDTMKFAAVPGTSQIVFLLFVVIVTVVLQNLISGLAVNDTQRIQETAQVLSLEQLVGLLTNIEKSLHSFSKWGIVRYLFPRIDLFTVAMYKKKKIVVEPKNNGKVDFVLEGNNRTYYLDKAVIDAANDIILTQKKCKSLRTFERKHE